VLSLLIKTFIFQSYWIPSGSMRPTLEVDDRILVSVWRPGTLELRHGDVVVFKDPGGWLTSAPTADDSSALVVGAKQVLTFVGILPHDAGEHLIKRVIGLPGDHVVCTDPAGAVTVNDVALDEGYIMPGSQPCGQAFDVIVPDGYLWVMGDNRDNSADSRAHTGLPGGGTIPVSQVVGTAFSVVWPLEHWSGVGNTYEP
jgi:signal peptidase I